MLKSLCTHILQGAPTSKIVLLFALDNILDLQTIPKHNNHRPNRGSGPQVVSIGCLATMQLTYTGDDFAQNGSEKREGALGHFEPPIGRSKTEVPRPSTAPRNHAIQLQAGA